MYVLVSQEIPTQPLFICESANLFLAVVQADKRKRSPTLSFSIFFLGIRLEKVRAQRKHKRDITWGYVKMRGQIYVCYLRN